MHVGLEKHTLVLNIIIIGGGVGGVVAAGGGLGLAGAAAGAFSLFWSTLLSKLVFLLTNRCCWTLYAVKKFIIILLVTDSPSLRPSFDVSNVILVSKNLPAITFELLASLTRL